MQVHDLSRQAQSDTRAMFLGCEERHKDLVQYIRFDPVAIILEIDDNPVIVVDGSKD